MILGLGTDVVEVARIAASHARFGHRFLERILTAQEIATMPRQSDTWLAGRFAAKEAAVKALGTGFSQGIGPVHIEVRRTALGEPQLRFLGPALERAQALGVRQSHLSISHERLVAVAVAILEA